MQEDSRTRPRQSSQATILDRRAFLNYIPMALGVLSVPGTIMGQAPAPLIKYVMAKTIYGRARGVRKNEAMVFKGIPYAGSPTGQNRFKPAPKLKSWAGVRDALLYGAQSIQPADPAWPKEWKPAVSDENCLFLNVWTQGVAQSRAGLYVHIRL